MITKKFVLLISILILIISLTYCFKVSNNSISSEITVVKKEYTAEQAVQMKLEELDYKAEQPFEFIVLDDYIFLLYNEICYNGSYFVNEGYEFYMPPSSLMHPYKTNSPLFKKQINLLSVIKDDEKYIIQIAGYKENEGILVSSSNSPIKIYNNSNYELTKLFDSEDEMLTCIWFDVVDGLPDDYKVYAEYNGKQYPLIDAEQIQNLVG